MKERGAGQERKEEEREDEKKGGRQNKEEEGETRWGEEKIRRETKGKREERKM